MKEGSASFLREARLATHLKHSPDEVCYKGERRASFRSEDGSLVFTLYSAGVRSIMATELVYAGGLPLWSAQFMGGMTDLCRISTRDAAEHFHEGRLKRLTDPAPLPKTGISFGDFRYVYLEHGTQADGGGEEQLFHGCYLIYNIHFRHGLIR